MEKQKILELENVEYVVERVLNMNLDTKKQTILSNLNFSLYKGDVVGITGENGAGKSSMCKLLLGVEEATKGNVYFQGTNIKNISPRWKLNRDIGLVFQNVDEQFIGKTCREDSLLYLSNFSYSENEINTKIYKVADELGVKGLLDKPLKELSGGQKQLLAIAEVLALNPAVLILDEPTALLDTNNEKLVLNQLKKVKMLMNSSIIIVSHKPSELQITDKIVCLKNRTIDSIFYSNDFLTNKVLLDTYNLSIPSTTEIVYLLQQQGLKIPELKNISIDCFENQIIEFLNG